MKQATAWTGHVPADCEVSRRPITDAFVDGRLRLGGRWAIMHPGCHAEVGVGLGPGKGQLYRLSEGGEWLRTETAQDLQP